MNSILEEVRETEERMIRDRRYLHEYPELSGKEDHTVAYIESRLMEMDIPFLEVPNGGVLGFLGAAVRNLEHGADEIRRKGRTETDGPVGKTVLLRADIDALAINENELNLKQKKACISKIPGVGHLCGHDIHTAMLLGAGQVLRNHESELFDRNEGIILLFERGEEMGACANLIYLLDYLYEHKIRVDSCFAEHVRGTGLKTGMVSAVNGPTTSGAFGFEVELRGKGGHGAAPHNANSPIDCFAALYQALSQIPVKYIPAASMCSFSLGMVNAGRVWNIIPETLTFAGSYRYYEQTVGETVVKKFYELLASVCSTYNCSYTVREAIGPILPTVNNPDCAAIARESVKKALGGDHLTDFGTWTASEDFGYLAALYPGVMAFVGVENTAVGSGADNHSPFFDADEKAFVYGAALEVQYALDFLESEEPVRCEAFQGTPRDLLR